MQQQNLILNLNNENDVKAAAEEFFNSESYTAQRGSETDAATEFNSNPLNNEVDVKAAASEFFKSEANQAVRMIFVLRRKLI